MDFHTLYCPLTQVLGMNTFRNLDTTVKVQNAANYFTIEQQQFMSIFIANPALNVSVNVQSHSSCLAVLQFYFLYFRIKIKNKFSRGSGSVGRAFALQLGGDGFESHWDQFSLSSKIPGLDYRCLCAIMTYIAIALSRVTWGQAEVCVSVLLFHVCE